MMIGYLDERGIAYDNKLELYDFQLCDDKGLILYEGEQIIEEGNSKSVMLGYHTKWRTKAEKPFNVLDDTGKFSFIYRTNMRLICIRECRPSSKLQGGFAAPGSLEDVALTSELAKLGAREFFIIPLNEIIGWKKAWAGQINIYINVKETIHFLIFGYDDNPLLARFFDFLIQSGYPEYEG